jgi:hypothetical protein
MVRKRVSRWRVASPRLKRAFKTSLHPRELIIPSSKQEQQWADAIFSGLTGRSPRRRK